MSSEAFSKQSPGPCPAVGLQDTSAAIAVLSTVVVSSWMAGVRLEEEDKPCTRWKAWCSRNAALNNETETEKEILNQRITVVRDYDRR